MLSSPMLSTWHTRILAPGSVDYKLPPFGPCRFLCKQSFCRAALLVIAAWLNLYFEPHRGKSNVTRSIAIGDCFGQAGPGRQADGGPIMETETYLRNALEHAPKAKPVAVPSLRGWLVGEEQVFICNSCAGRIIDRGCHLPRPEEPVWDVLPEGCDCQFCRKAVA